MSDVHDTLTRSYNMSQIRSMNTKPELLVRKFLFSHGFRYRLHDNNLIGKPDIVLPKYKTIIFVHGCFWHGHENCKYFIIPKTRTEWWLQKIERNKQRDKENYFSLQNENWQVFNIFECELKKGFMDKTLLTLINKIKK